MSTLLATFSRSLQPVRVLLPNHEGLMKIETSPEKLEAEELARRLIAEVRLIHLHTDNSKPDIVLKRVSVAKNILWCAGCHMRLGIPAEETVGNVGELVSFLDEVRKGTKSPL